MPKGIRDRNGPGNKPTKPTKAEITIKEILIDSEVDGYLVTGTGSHDDIDEKTRIGGSFFDNSGNDKILGRGGNGTTIILNGVSNLSVSDIVLFLEKKMKKRNLNRILKLPLPRKGGFAAILSPREKKTKERKNEK